MEQIPAAMDRHLDVATINKEGGLLLGASSLTGRYWLGSLWFYSSPESAPNVENCSAGVQLEAGLSGAAWISAHHVLLAMDTGGVTIWELQDDNKTFGLVHSACEHDDIVSSVSVNADCSRFVSASHDKGIRIWDANLTSLNNFQAHSSKVFDVRCHPTEIDLFLSCSQDGRIILWDTRNSKPAIILEKSQSGSAPCCVAWQPSAAKMFGSGDERGSIVIRDLRAVVEKTMNYQHHCSAVTCLAFSTTRPGLLASGSEDCRTIIASLNSQTTQSLYINEAHSDFVKNVAWNDRGMLLSCGWDGQVVWHIPRDEDLNDDASSHNGGK